MAFQVFIHHGLCLQRLKMISSDYVKQRILVHYRCKNCTEIAGCLAEEGYSFTNVARTNLLLLGKLLAPSGHSSLLCRTPLLKHTIRHFVSRFVGLFRHTHCIPSGNNTTTSDLWQRETRTFVGRSYTEILRSQKGTLRMNEIGSKGFFHARSFR